MIQMHKPKLLLHGCCGPCITHPFQMLQDKYDVTIYFYNPNIHPKSEYERRLQAVKDLSQRWDFPLLVGPYDVEQWFKAVRRLENEPEGGKRCGVCYRFRMEKTAEVAAVKNFNLFGITLTVSPHKKADLIHTIGQACESRFGVSYLDVDFKKKDGFKISCLLSQKEGLYRQNYCGCVFSHPSKNL